MDEPRMFYCDCECSALAVSYDEQYQEIMISPWVDTGFDLHTWHAKLRFIRHILKWGHPYTDFVIHSPQRARELGTYLLELADTLDGSEEA